MNGKMPFGDLGVCQRILLKWAHKKYGVGMWTGFIWLRTGSSGGLF
jgi:hypothetical protein